MIGVRQAGEADLAGIAAVALACGQPPTDSGADPAYARHLLAHGTLMAAVDRERHVVGFGATRRVGSASALTDLFVLPDRQGGGIGGAILRCLWDADAETKLTPIGSVSVTTTPVAVFGPLLVTVIVYVIVAPTVAGSADAVFVTER